MLASLVVYICLDPALALCSLYYATVFGIIYLIIVTYADVFASGCHHSVGIVGVDFLAIGVGMVISTVITAKVQQSLFSKGNNPEKRYKPESRLLSGLAGALVCAGGISLYGFTALKTHFIVPLIGLAIFAMGGMNVMAILLYVVDSFEFAASAFTAVSVLRCVFAGVFPLFGAKLFDKLGLDWDSGLLSFICVGLIPFIPALYKYGKKLRSIGNRNMKRFTSVA